MPLVLRICDVDVVPSSEATSLVRLRNTEIIRVYQKEWTKIGITILTNVCTNATVLAVASDGQNSNTTQCPRSIPLVGITIDPTKDTPKNQIQTATVSAMFFVNDTLYHIGWTMAK